MNASASRLFLSMLLSGSLNVAVADETACGPLTNGWGPYDYRSATPAQLANVEPFHFTPKVEALIEGETATLGWDIAWTLHSFPNHHRALRAMSRLGLREKREQLRGAKYSVECYFERAIRYSADDPVPYALHGLHLAKLGNPAAAERALDQSAALSSGDANLHYNLGLGYAELRLNDKALEHAKRAYDAGFPLPGLRDRLRKAGVWRD